jgi:hypothetical protein
MHRGKLSASPPADKGDEFRIPFLTPPKQFGGVRPRKIADGFRVVRVKNPKNPVTEPRLAGPFATETAAWRAIRAFVDARDPGFF